MSCVETLLVYLGSKHSPAFAIFSLLPISYLPLSLIIHQVISARTPRILNIRNTGYCYVTGFKVISEKTENIIKTLHYFGKYLTHQIRIILNEWAICPR